MRRREWIVAFIPLKEERASAGSKVLVRRLFCTSARSFSFVKQLKPILAPHPLSA